MKTTLIFFSIVILLFLSGCSNQEATAEAKIEATVISLNDVYENAGIEFQIGGETVIALLDELTPVQYAYMKTHRNNIELAVDILAIESSCGSNSGAYFTFYLLGKKIQTVKCMEYDQFIKIGHKIPTFRYTIINGQPQDTLEDNLEKVQ